MGADNTFKLKIVASNRVFYDGRAQTLVIPAVDGGEVGFLAQHENCVTPVEVGEMRIKDTQGKIIHAFVGSGFLEFVNNEATLVCVSAELPNEIDARRAKEAKERAEEAARKVWREQFDLASARAVAALPMLAEYCLPLVKVGGNFLAMKGASGEEELTAARGAIKKLGGEYRETRTLHLPGGDTRTLILCKKISQTPTAYPRNGGKIAKSPLK